MTCEEFIETKEVSDYNRFFFCQTFHHVFDPEPFLKKIYERIPVGSKIILAQLVENLLWADLKKMSKPVTSRPTEQYLSNAGFTVSKHVESDVGIRSKEEYFEGLRNRMWSALQLYSDEEIEKGIAELERDYFQGDNVAGTNITFAFYVGTKVM